MKIKKILSSILAAAMLFTSVSLMPVSAEESGERTPVIKVDFDTAENYTLHGSASLVTGRNGNALSLDGLAAAGAADGAYAKIKDGEAAMKALSGDYSISVWFNPSSTPVWSRVYDLGADTDNYVFLTTSSGSLPRYAVKSATEQSVDSDTAFTTGVWHNVTVVSSGSTTAFYLDGLKRGTTTSITHKPSDVSGYANMYLGKSQWPDAYYAGLIDDFEVYDCALTEKEVQTLAAEVYDNYKNLMIYQNNCLDTDTHFYLDGEEIFSLNVPEDKPYITDKSIENGKASYTVHNLLKAGDKFGDITAYAAQFDAQKKLVGLKRFAHSEREWTQEVTDVRKIEFDYTEIAGATAKLLVWYGVEPLSETAPAEDNRTLRVVTDISNYTAETTTVATQLYSIRDNGAQYKQYTESEILSIEPLETKQLVLETAVKDLRKNDEKLIVELDDFGTGMVTIGQEMATLWYGVESPVAAPADSGTTTDGAHDPSIVKFPGDDTYYVYSSHHLIFTSEDLINWKKYDFHNKKVQTISEKTYNFIKNNINSNVNETYWAPDVIYREGDEHPYWMYISVSCGLSGRNSAISLMKSDSPLFWADSKAHIIDAGVVFATKENNSYKTNAIDAHIYTDTDGQQYFVWGSFWGGIQAAKLKDDGFVEGIDYTSDATILSSCANFGTTVFSQGGNGMAGPEGAWMIDNGQYRYMFTSYGWLESNYNTRIARAPLSKKFSEGMGTQLVDAKNTVMGNEITAGGTKKAQITGYKLIGSYRLGDGSMSIETKINPVNNRGSYYVPREGDDAHIYYGPGHNSAITADNGETFYVSHTRKDAVSIGATLQVRKMLFTEDGWPVVSPVTYAGEKEQALPKEMLAGTYDLASVGQTKMDGASIVSGTYVNANYDLPVLSSKVTLNADGTMADGLGTWTFDGDHTVTLKFAKNGDEAKDEFYKNGDIMTMYALYGYDKDEREPVIALTGTDQNHITQFAKKSMASKYKTPAKLPELNIEPISLEKSVGNPELGFDADGNILYAGDPAATVIGDTVYLIAGHDTASDESYVMPEWVLYTSKNMTDWEYKDVVMKATDISWRSNDTSAWASQMTEYNGKYYLYFCTWDKTSGGKRQSALQWQISPRDRIRISDIRL